MRDLLYNNQAETLNKTSKGFKINMVQRNLIFISSSIFQVLASLRSVRNNFTVLTNVQCASSK